MGIAGTRSALKKNWDKKLAAELSLAFDYSKHSGKLKLAAVQTVQSSG